MPTNRMSRRFVRSMKFKVYFHPAPIALALIAVAGLFWLASLTIAGGQWLLVFGYFYTVLSVFVVWSLIRITRIERTLTWSQPARLLVLAPHEDDCVIAAGGIGVRNGRLGGVTRIVYLAPDETPGLPEIRAAEACAAWAYAGLQESELWHIPLLPPLRDHDPASFARLP